MKKITEKLIDWVYLKVFNNLHKVTPESEKQSEDLQADLLKALDSNDKEKYWAVHDQLINQKVDQVHDAFVYGFKLGARLIDEIYHGKVPWVD